MIRYRLQTVLPIQAMRDTLPLDPDQYRGIDVRFYDDIEEMWDYVKQCFRNGFVRVLHEKGQFIIPVGQVIFITKEVEV